MRVSANGGTPEPLMTVKEGEQAHGPQMLPGGETVLFTLATGTAVGPVGRGADRDAVAEIGRTKDSREVAAMRAICRPATWFTRAGSRIRRPVGPSPAGGHRRSGSDRGGRQASGPGHHGRCPIRRLKHRIAHLRAGPVSTAMGQSDLALIDRKGGVEPLKLHRVPTASSGLSERQVYRLGIDDGKEANVWIYDLDGPRRPGGSHSGARTGFRSGRRTASAWRSSRIGKATSASSGSARTAPVRGAIDEPDQGVSHVPESWSPT